MKLQSRLKLAHDRCVDPAETIARLEALIRPRHDYWLHEETLSEHLHWSAMFIEGLDFRSMGKGVTRECSLAGALAEGAEWLTARATGELPGYLGAREHEVPDALPITSLLGHIATATPPVLERIRALDDAFHWVDGWSLIHERALKVPLEYVRLIGGPNGKATGNNIEEAIIHAAHEIFERRAHITVLRNRMVVPTIDSESITHPIVRAQMEFLRARGIEVVLKDLSFGGVLPCLGAYFVDRNIPEDFQFRHFFKVGASFDRRRRCCGCSPNTRRGGDSMSSFSRIPKTARASSRACWITTSAVSARSRTTATISSRHSCLDSSRIGTPISSGKASWCRLKSVSRTPTALKTSRTRARSARRWERTSSPWT